MRRNEYAGIIRQEIQTNIWDNRILIQQMKQRMVKATQCKNYTKTKPNRSFINAEITMKELQDQNQRIRSFQLLYREMPTYYKWAVKTCRWMLQKDQQTSYVRLYNAYPGTKRYYIRTLLLHKRGNLYVMLKQHKYTMRSYLYRRFTKK